MTNMFKGFRDFILRGNVIDLAVAFVIGAAFVKLIGAFCDDFVLPIVNSILGGGTTGGKVHLSGNNYLDFGAFINAVITFVLTAAVLYFIFVLPINKLRERKSADGEPAAETELDLLREIRDGLNRAGPQA
jgi:large conductance mechanosensitive channel